MNKLMTGSLVAAAILISHPKECQILPLLEGDLARQPYFLLAQTLN
jgi:hypothetical protein